MILKADKEYPGHYIGNDISENELKYIRNLILASPDPCRFCPENKHGCGKYGVEYRICNDLVREIDYALGDLES